MGGPRGVPSSPRALTGPTYAVRPSLAFDLGSVVNAADSGRPVQPRLGRDERRRNRARGLGGVPGNQLPVSGVVFPAIATERQSAAGHRAGDGVHRKPDAGAALAARSMNETETTTGRVGQVALEPPAT